MAKVELENLSEKGYEECSERGFGQYKEGKLGRKAPFRLPLRLSGGPVRGFAAQFQRDCMKSPQRQISRLSMRRIMAAYTNASLLAHSLS
jgi:hypothetical protein